MASTDKPTILLIDDDPVFRRLMSVMFNQEGFKIVTADNAQEGLTLVEENDFNVAVVDYRLPDLTGIDFFERVHRTHPNMIRILLTAYTTETVLLEAINRGHVFRYLLKPVYTDLLLSSVEQALAIREMAIAREELTRRTEIQNRELTLRNDDLRQAYIQLEEMKLLQDQILGMLPQPIFLIGENRRVIGCNQAACKLVGYSRGELLGRLATDVFGKEVDIFGEAQPQGTTLSEHNLKISLNKKEGTIEPMMVKMHILRNIKGDGYKMALIMENEGG